MKETIWSSDIQILDEHLKKIKEEYPNFSLPACASICAEPIPSSIIPIKAFPLPMAPKTGKLIFSPNLTKIAKILNAGRASVYRAIDALEKLELIRFENKKIYISDLKGLERITK